MHSQAAVLANICHEYIEFGTEAFKDNTLQTLFISTDSMHYIAKPVYNLILCFICTKDVNLGLVRSKVCLILGYTNISYLHLLNRSIARCHGRVPGARSRTDQGSSRNQLSILLIEDLYYTYLRKC